MVKSSNLTLCRNLFAMFGLICLLFPRFAIRQLSVPIITRDTLRSFLQTCERYRSVSGAVHRHQLTLE